jgi:hypothetical protein
VPKKCWIIGNGLSLRETPPEQIDKMECTFGTNLIAKRFDHAWRPHYYIAISTGVHIPEYRPLFGLAAKETQWTTFVTPENEEIINEYTDLTNTINVYNEGKPDWYQGKEKDLAFCNHAMSHLVSFQLANMMGYETMYLIGFDGNFKPQEKDGTDLNHFAKDYWGKFQQERPKDPEFWTRMNHDHMVAHSYVRSISEEKGFKVINCTPNSAYKMYDYMPFEEAIRG